MEQQDQQGFMDTKLARGLARVIGRDIGYFGDLARQQSFLFALELMKRNMDGEKLTGPFYNVMLSKIINAAKSNDSTLRISSERMGLNKSGMFQRQSLQEESVRHFTGNSEFLSQEWIIAMDYLQIERGIVRGRFWKAPVLFDPHIIERFLHRSGAFREERLSGIADAGLPLATLYRACSIDAKNNNFYSLDIVLPAPGGVLCGGTEVVESKSLGDSFIVGEEDSQWGIHSSKSPSSLHLTSSIRTYLDDGLLDQPQRGLIVELRNWSNENEERIRRDPIASFSWPGKDSRPINQELIDDFRPLCSKIQANFTGWKRSVEEKEIDKIDWRVIGEKYTNELPSQEDHGWVGKQMGFKPKPKWG